MMSLAALREVAGLDILMSAFMVNTPMILTGNGLRMLSSDDQVAHLLARVGAEARDDLPARPAF